MQSPQRTCRVPEGIVDLGSPTITFSFFHLPTTSSRHKTQYTSSLSNSTNPVLLNSDRPPLHATVRPPQARLL